MVPENDKGFKVSDKRLFRQDTEGAAGTDAGRDAEVTAGGGKSGGEKSEAPEAGPDAEQPQGAMPPVDFTAFILSLASTVLMHLGEVPDPQTQQNAANLDMARQTVDVLGIIQEKTRGNLTREEDRLLENLLSDLRLRYLRAIKYLT